MTSLSVLIFLEKFGVQDNSAARITLYDIHGTLDYVTFVHQKFFTTNSIKTKSHETVGHHDDQHHCTTSYCCSASSSTGRCGYDGAATTH